METIKPFTSIREMRIRASERIHAMFKGAPVICVKYRDNFAEGYCQYMDGVIATFTVWYRDLLKHPSACHHNDGQHGRAIAMLGIENVEPEYTCAL